MFFSTPLCFFEDSDIITDMGRRLEKILQENLQWKNSGEELQYQKTGENP